MPTIIVTCMVTAFVIVAAVNYYHLKHPPTHEEQERNEHDRFYHQP